MVDPTHLLVLSFADVRHSATGGVPMGYDSRAELTSYAGWSYTFDAKGQLLTATNGGTNVGFIYDALGRRTRRYVNGVLQRIYHYDGWRVVEERDGSNQKVYSYLYGAGGELMERVAANGAPTWYHHDARGFVTHLSGGDASVLEQYLYDAYGGVYVLDAAGNQRPGNASTQDNHFLWADGYEWQPELGLYLCGHRFYSPKLGRWLSPDPSGMGGGDVNWQRYCGNDPVNGCDPSGLLDEDDQPKYADGGGGGGVSILGTGDTPTGSNIPSVEYSIDNDYTFQSNTVDGITTTGFMLHAGQDPNTATTAHGGIAQDKSPVVIVYWGFGGGHDDPTNSNNVPVQISNQATSDGMNSQALGRDQQDYAASYIQTAVDEGASSVSIVGYSRGAIAAIETENTLNSMNIEVDNLITIDPVTFFGGQLNVPSNVSHAYNFYETNGGFEGILPGTLGQFGGTYVNGAQNWNLTGDYYQGKYGAYIMTHPFIPFAIRPVVNTILNGP